MYIRRLQRFYPTFCPPCRLCPSLALPRASLQKEKADKPSNKFEFLSAFLLAEREGFGVNPKSSLYKAVIQSKICEVAFTTGKDSCFFKTGKQILKTKHIFLSKAYYIKVYYYKEYSASTFCL